MTASVYMLGQAAEGPAGLEMIAWVAAALAGLWLALRVLRLLTNLFARVVWIVALIGAVIWIVLMLAGTG